MSRTMCILPFVVVSGVLISMTHKQGQPTMPAGTISLPPKVQTKVDELLLLSQREFVPPPDQAWGGFFPQGLYKLHGKFLNLLKALDGQINQNLAETCAHDTAVDIQCHFINIARDFNTYPKRYEELVDDYARRPRQDKRWHVFRVPDPSPQHAVEKYRLTWELLLVAPCSDESQFMRRACFKAIGIIRNDASIPVLLCLYKRANAGVKSGFRRDEALDEQLRIFGTLHLYCNSSALRAILRCLAISEEVLPPPKTSEFTMREWAIRYLRDEINVSHGKQWRPVIQKALETEKLSDVDRAFLNEVLKGQGKGQGKGDITDIP